MGTSHLREKVLALGFMVLPCQFFPHHLVFYLSRLYAVIYEQSSPDGCVEVFLIIAKRVLADQEGQPRQRGTSTDRYTQGEQRSPEVSLIRFWKGDVFENIRQASVCLQTELGEGRGNWLAEGVCGRGQAGGKGGQKGLSR